MDVRECNDLSRAEAAVRYARLGWHVLPLWWPNPDGTCACGDAACSNVAKHPLGVLVPHGRNDATTDVTWVEDWWRRYPQANVGVSCAPSGLLALDVDSGKVLPEDWPDYVNTGRRPPRTLVARSGRADPAYHVLYSTKALPPDVRVRGKVHAPGAPGVDKTLVRFNNYIVVAPSLHASGQRYRWLNSERVAPPDEVLLGRLTYAARDDYGGGGDDGAAPAGERATAATSYSDLVQVAVARAEGGESRAEVGHWLACQLRDNGCAEADARRVWLPVFYREVVALRPDAPDADIVTRWARNAWSTPPRAPLPAFDPAVRAVVDAARAVPAEVPAAPPAPAAAVVGHERPGDAPAVDGATGTADQREEVDETGAGGPGDGQDDVAPPVPARPDPGGPGLLTVDEAAYDEARHPVNATDLGNARRFVRLFTGQALYVADVGRWYVWDGNRWKPDVSDDVLRLAAAVVDDVRQTALLAENPDDRTRWNAWAHQTEAAGRQRALVDLARPRMATTVDEFDRDPWLLVVENGTVELDTLTFRESRPEELCSRQAAVRYDPDETCPRWRAHVKFVSAADVELASYLRRAIGYTVTGLTSERAFFFLQGDGSNGKNVFIEPVMRLLGDYGTTASSALLTGGDEQHPTIVADLLGARLVFVDETRAGRRLNAERIKGLTGSARVKARYMRGNFFEFDPAFKLWITGNGRPAVRDPSDGAWKRLHEVPCLGKVGRDVRLIKDYGETLYAEEASGILNWALEGLADWRATGLSKPSSVQRAIDEHRDEEDFVGQFVDECLEVTDDPADRLAVPAVYTEYARWSKEQGLRGDNFLSKIAFGRALTTATGRQPKSERVDGHPTRIVRGLRWSADASVEARIMAGQITRYSSGD